MDEKEFQKRIESEARCMERVTNKDLTCRNCMFALDDTEVLGNTSRCRVYRDGKPNQVLLGKECKKKEVKP